ncbi:MAG: hypothetical protein IV100_11215 [Myxococcales bacterium]|nr:hypothetical protein [Myxococcales bacterium]
MAAEYDFARVGRPVLAGHVDFVLGHQAIRPFALDALVERLQPYPLKWDYIRFAAVNRDMVPKGPGIYLFVVHPRSANIERHSIILYFGRTKSLQSRFGDYLTERDTAGERSRKHVSDMLNIYKNRIEFGYANLDYYDTEKVEDLLIDAFRPCCNQHVRKPLSAF